MPRKLLIAALAILAIILSAFALQADADHLDKTCTSASGGYGAVQCAYPGPFTTMPAHSRSAFGFAYAGATTPGDSVTGAALPEAGAANDPLARGTVGGLAHTGTEGAALGYLGACMIAFGAVAMGSRRKLFQGAPTG